MEKTTFRLIALLLISILSISCQSSKKTEWTPPKLVKEWEIKEIKPGLTPDIISMTANKNGVFVLVNAKEVKFPEPKKFKKSHEMTSEERRLFFIKYNGGCMFSGSDVFRMTNDDKNELIDLLVNHFIPPRKASEMTKDEKDNIFNFIRRHKEEKGDESEKQLFRKRLKEKGKDNYINEYVNGISDCIRWEGREEVQQYRIQHYDFDGNFIKQWPDEETLFKNPIKIITDSSGNIYTADYESNEIIKFNADGELQDRWEMLPRTQIGEGIDFAGVTINKNDNILIIGEGEVFITPELFEYDTGGKLIRSKELKSKEEARAELSKSLSPFNIKIERIVDIEVDDKGDIFLLEHKYGHIGMTPSLIKLNPQWIEESKTKVVLEKEFDASKLKQFKETMKNTLATILSWINTVPDLYLASNLFFDGKYLYVLFTGSKPFGVIDAAIYNTEGKMVGHWKQNSRSNMEWFKSLGEDIEVVDYNLFFTQYGESVFIGRTMHIRKGAFYEKSVIQKFSKES